MFGDLFYEADSGDPPPSSSTSNSGTAALDQPEKRRSVNRLCGLRNQGATCYLNSLLQTLFLTRELRDAFFELERDELGELEGSKEDQVRKIPVELRRLFCRLLLLDVNAVTTASLTDSFGWSGSEVVQQHDVQELNRILFTALDDSLVGTAGSALIKQLYHGELVNQVHCLSCGYCSERRESFLDISVPVANVYSLEAALQSLYCEKESLSGANQYHCSQCDKKVDASKGAVLSDLPKILTFSLLRFQYDWQKGERYKETGRFSFPDTLNMAPFVLKQGADSELVYELFSVVVHRGGAHGGHYFAYIRDVDGLGTWTEPDKGSVLVETDDGMDLTECDSPLSVIVTLLIQHKKTSPSPVSTDQLSKMLQKQTGVSWNKRFKAKYGPLMKFLRRHNDAFCVDSDGGISLVEGFANEKPVATDGTSSPATQKPSVVPVSNGAGSVCAVSDHWFNFNDGWVTPVEKKALESAFMGRESAYMLFYRQRVKDESYKHEQAIGNIPVHLQCEVAEENAELEERREAYEVAVNTVRVNVHNAADFHCPHGVLQRHSGSEDHTTVDKRQRFEQLAAAVGRLPGEVTQVFTAQPCPSGLHLLQEVPHSVPSLAEGGILDKCHIVVCTGDEKFAVEDMLLGADQTPVLVRCQFEVADDVTPIDSELERPFSQMTSVSDMVAMFCQQHNRNLPPSIVVRSPKDKSAHTFSMEEGSKTLKEVGIVDGSVVSLCGGTIADDVAAPAVRTVTQHSVVVENHVSISTADQVGAQAANGVGTWTVKCVYLPDGITVGDVKRSVIDGAVEVADSLRLRTEHVTTLGPPLCDSSVIADLEWPDGQQVVLEVGKSPGADEMVLAFELGGDSKDGRLYEVLVHSSQMVQDCVDAMCLQCGLSNYADWHIRKTNWCGEAADILDDPMATISSTGVQNGDFLLLLSGSPPPRDCVRLSVHLCCGSDEASSEGKAASGMMAWLTSVVNSSLSLGIRSLALQGAAAVTAPASDGSTDSSSVDPATSAENQESSADPNKKAAAESPPYQFVATVDVKKVAKVDEVKAAILSLSAFKNSDADVDRLRVRRLVEKRPGRIFRPGDTVRGLKLVSGSDILCQVLDEAEHLPAASIVLNACQRHQETRSYAEPQEVVLSTQDGCNVAGLKKCIIQHFDLNADAPDILCAKHFPEQFDWVTILDNTTSKAATASSGQGKGKKSGPSPRKPLNLRNAPFHLQDGDTIGFKVASEERSSTLKDFRTAADEAGLKRLEEIKEEKRKARKARQGNNSDVTRRVEIGIRIVVPQYQAKS